MDKKVSPVLPSEEALRQRVVLGLRQMRRALGLNQWDVASKAKCSQSSVSMAERGIRLHAALIARIVKALLELDAEAKRLKR